MAEIKFDAAQPGSQRSGAKQSSAAQLGAVGSRRERCTTKTAAAQGATAKTEMARGRGTRRLWPSRPRAALRRYRRSRKHRGTHGHSWSECRMGAVIAGRSCAQTSP